MHDINIAVKQACFNHKEGIKLFLVTYFIEHISYRLRGICTKAISLESYYYLTLANFPCYILEGSQNSLKETNILIMFVFVVCLNQ